MDKKYLLPVIIVLVIVAATIYLVGLLKKEDETMVLHCGIDQSMPVIVFKNPTKAFPAFATEYTVKLNAGIQLMDTLAKAVNAGGTMSSDISSKTIILREALNQENIRVENLLKANFYAFNTNPCDSFVRRKYYSFLDTLTGKITEIERLRSEVTIQPEKGGVVSNERQLIQDTAKIRESLDRFSERFFPNKQ